MPGNKTKRKREVTSPANAKPLTAPEPLEAADTPTAIREMLKPGPPPLRIGPVITLQTALVALGLFVLVKFLMAVWQVIILVLFALILAAALNPLVERVSRWTGRTLAVVVIVVAFLALLIGAAFLIGPPLYYQTMEMVGNAPQLLAGLEQLLARHGMHVNLHAQVGNLSGRLEAAIPKILETLTTIGKVVAGVVIVIVMSIYMLIETPKLRRTVQELLPPERRTGAERMLHELGQQVGGYVRGQLVASVLAGVFSIVILLWQQVPDALALGALAFLLDVLPMIGVLIATLLAVLMALTISAKTALIVLIGYLLYHQLESHVIIPQVYGNTLNLSLTAIVISVVTGAELIGMAGVILALPVAAAVPAIVRFIYEWRLSKLPEGKAAAVESHAPGDGAL